MYRFVRGLVVSTVCRSRHKTPNELKHLRLNTRSTKWVRQFNSAPIMGHVNSTQGAGPVSKTETEKGASFFRSMKLISPPVGKASDALDLRITLDKKIRLQMHQAKVEGVWKVELEIDIAQFQERHKLVEKSTNFKDEFEHIHISEDSLTRILKDKTTEMMANICAIHIRLDDRRDNALSDNLVVIMDVSHGGYENVGSSTHLTRRLYGVESDFVRSRWPS